MLRSHNQKALVCDCCGAVFDDTPRGIGDQLQKARAAGWSVSPRPRRDSDRDYCPDIDCRANAIAAAAALTE